MLIEVSETNRLDGREAIFENGAKRICIDHHVSSRALYDYNLIDTHAAATAEIVYDLLEEQGTDIDAQIAEAVYVGLVTDTGRFQFSNTTPRSHQIAAELLERGVQPNKVSTEIYHSMRLEKLYLENAVMSTTISVKDGRGLIAHLTQAMLEESGALEEETEGLAEKLRSFRGVEVSVFLRETEDGRTKASMRSKNEYDVAALAGKFGGGGHIRAAGFTSTEPLAQIEQQILRVLNDTL
jgi:phosphoesterase RecJ-like protein